MYNSSGTLLGSSSGTDYCFKFSIYTASSGGTKLWPSSDPSTMTISVVSGVFNAPIGDTSAGGDALDYNFYDSDETYLNVQVAASSGGSCSGVTSFESLTPRQRIVSSGYAINANTIGGFAPSQSAVANQIPVLNSSGNLVFGGAAIIGNNSSTVAIDTSDWDIGATGIMTGIGAITSDGLITGTAGLTITGAAVSLNASSNFDLNFATGTSTGDITLGGGTAGQLISINSDDWDISTSGDMTGIGTITADGLVTANASLNIANGATSSGILKILEDTDAGSNFATFQVPALAGNTVYILPADDGEAGEQLQSDGSGTLTWESAGGIPTTITVANEATDSSSYIAFFTAATGDLGPKTNAGLTFDSSTAILTATGFAGPLTGNVTGNVSGTAATVTGAAQTAITSLGTLTGLTMGGAIDMATNVINNIGDNSTDFLAGGGLTLADILTVNDDLTVALSGNENVEITDGATPTTDTLSIISDGASITADANALEIDFTTGD
ncbi:MAG: hypothetical protein Q7K39_04870, partial [Candidatus Magasanikbacteria bacterium]|nr:hypothetical protein [Candidatus Magasanikbacteria bacterium]